MGKATHSRTACWTFFATVIHLTHSDIAWSSVKFWPRHMTNCYATEIRLELQVDGGVQPGDVVYLYLAGFTSGTCANKPGGNINRGAILLWPRSGWTGSWSEGTVAEEYRNSYLTLWARDIDSSLGYRHTIVIDPSNNIRPNCGVPANSSAIRVSVTASNDSAAAFWRPVNQSDPVDARCYLTDTSVFFRPAVPKLPSAVKIGFKSSLTLRGADRLVVQLGGWTSGNARGQAGFNIPLGEVQIQDGDTMAGNNSMYFRAEWLEGCCYRQHEPGFANSSLVLVVRPSVTIIAGTFIEVIVRNGQIRAQCGMAASYEHFHIRVLPNTNSSIRHGIPATPFESANAIGSGCALLNYCSGHGNCNHCLSRCDCEHGYGAKSEVPHRQREGWSCSNFSCPIGPTWGGMPMASGFAHSEFSECSGAGTCLRKTGSCSCYAAFAGPACERRVCPGFSVETGECSGHGVCASMRDLSMMDEALPLSSYQNRSYAFTASEFPSEAWDSRVLFGCVCDSSWPVGLEAGERDLPEWFGPDCSLRHCPSGDDPLTARDETDCSNKTSASGKATFKNGSICHVDCSNRGICDHSTGLCSCFRGFRGPNCHIVDILAKGGRELLAPISDEE